MTSHELAAKLLALPDAPVGCITYDIDTNGLFEEVGSIEASEDYPSTTGTVIVLHSFTE